MIDKEKAAKYKEDVKKSKSKSDYNPMDKFEVSLNFRRDSHLVYIRGNK